MQSDLKIIKNRYGEKMAHLCRILFPTILENEGVLPDLLSSSFAPSKFLYDDLVKFDAVYMFKDYIYDLYDVEDKVIVTNKTPEELLDEVGYNLYECHSKEEVDSFSKYYAENESLCTFNDNRLDRCFVFFAVKKDVDNIRREDFKNPERQDLYGTSVMSIQFARGKVNTLSIKNRYNHRVNHPDATFNNNLDKIIPGLTASFESKYNLNVNSGNNRLLLPGYVLASDGILYKYNYEMNNIYYGPGNVIVDNYKAIHKYSDDKARYLVFDYFVLDLKDKKVIKYDDKLTDSFTDGLSDIDKIEVRKDYNSNKHIIISSVDDIIEIVIDNENKIVEYRNNKIQSVGDNFLRYNSSLKNIELSNVRYVGNKFLYRSNNSLTNIDLSNLVYAGNYFLYSDTNMKNIDFPNLRKIGDRSLYFSRAKNINMPNIEEFGKECFRYNINAGSFDFPKLVYYGRNTFNNNDNFYDYVENNINQQGGRIR